MDNIVVCENKKENSFLDKLKSNKKLRVLLIVFAVIICVSFLLTSFNFNNSKQENADVLNTYVSNLQEKLENALSNGSLTADDIIKLNNEISEINDQINRLTITINNYEQQTAYSTVTLSISRKESAASSIVPLIVLAVLSPIIFCSIYFPVSRTKRRTAERVRREKEEQLRMQELLNNRNQSNNQ
jgi:predicted PurR-regulated permease PerM